MAEPDRDRADELADAALDWVQTNVLRLVATKVVPLILSAGALNVALAWLQAELGLGLDPAEVATFIGSTMAGVVAVAFGYVRNHGQGAAIVGRALLEVEKLKQIGAQQPYFGGSQLQEAPHEPTAPPGLQPDFEGHSGEPDR